MSQLLSIYETQQFFVIVILRHRVATKKKKIKYDSNFVTGARIAGLLCTEITQKIYRGGAEVDFFSRSRY